MRNMRWICEGKFFFTITLITFALFLIVLTFTYEGGELSKRSTSSPLKSSVYEPSNRCKLSYGKYDGSLWTKERETNGRTCLLESKRMRVDHHIRRLPGGDKINDWLWIDYGDRVNVLVREQAGDESAEGGGKFLVLEQTKYALEGSSLAVVGGFIEPNETPQEAALREVREELGMICDISKLKALGRYRTDVNRGLGWVNGFLADDCSASTASNKNGALQDVVDADAKQELQELRRLTLKDVHLAVMAGRFVEVQWSNTVSLALLHLQSVASFK